MRERQPTSIGPVLSATKCPHIIRLGEGYIKDKKFEDERQQDRRARLQPLSSLSDIDRMAAQIFQVAK